MKIYATVSRAHIYQAIGLRDRYKEYKHSDECSGCPYRDDNNFDSCIRCRKLKVNYIMMRIVLVSGTDLMQTV